MKVFQCLRTGNIHRFSNRLCEDYIESRLSDDFSLNVLCDGASSATYSSVGAFNVARALITSFFENDEFSEFITNNPKFKKLPRTEIIKLLMQEEYKSELCNAIINIVHGRIYALAKSMKVHPAHFSSTLIMVMTDNKKTVVVHIGDGFVGATKNCEPYVLSAPENIDGNLCKTHFITDFDACDHLRVEYFDTVFDTMLISSDGYYHVLGDDSNTLKYILSKLEDLQIDNDLDFRKTILHPEREQEYEDLLFDDCSVIYVKNNKRLSQSEKTECDSKVKPDAEIECDEIAKIKEEIQINAENITNSILLLIDTIAKSSNSETTQLKKEVQMNAKKDKRKARKNNKSRCKWIHK